jgi:hypothetical protein
MAFLGEKVGKGSVWRERGVCCLVGEGGAVVRLVWSTFFIRVACFSREM